MGLLQTIRDARKTARALHEMARVTSESLPTERIDSMSKGSTTSSTAAAKEAATRIHLVTDTKTGDRWLVDSTSRSQARASVTADRFTVELPNAREVVDLMRANVPVLMADAQS